MFIKRLFQRLMLKSRSFTTILLAAVVLYGITFLFVLPLVCRKLPYSWYFAGEQNDVQLVREVFEASDQRYEAAKRYLKGLYM